MLLEHWKHSHHDIILGHKTSHSTFVPLNSRNQMRMNTTNLDSEHEVSSLKNYEDRTEKKKQQGWRRKSSYHSNPQVK